VRAFRRRTEIDGHLVHDHAHGHGHDLVHDPWRGHDVRLGLDCPECNH
jgi:hypothetical protein